MAIFTNPKKAYDSVTGTGEPIQISGTVIGSATTIHTITDGDEARVMITAVNTSATDVELGITVGGDTTADICAYHTVSAKSTRQIYNNVLKASGANLVLKAYASTTNVINVSMEIHDLSEDLDTTT